jgi:hypothetical protein
MKNLEAASDKLPRLRGACPLCRAPLCILGLVRGCIMIVTWPSDETWQLMAVVGHHVSPKHRETPKILIKSVSLRHVLRFRNITPSLRSLRPSFLILKPETSRVLGAASKDNRRSSELWNSIDGEVSPWPGSTWPVWYLPFLPQQPRVALTPAAVYCQIICVSFFHLPAEGNPRLRTSSILIFQQPHTASGRQASVECIWGPAATADPGSGGLGVDP